MRQNLADWNYKTLEAFVTALVNLAKESDEDKAKAIEVLTYLNDIRLPLGEKSAAGR